MNTRPEDMDDILSEADAKLTKKLNSTAFTKKYWKKWRDYITNTRMLVDLLLGGSMYAFSLVSKYGHFTDLSNPEVHSEVSRLVEGAKNMGDNLNDAETANNDREAIEIVLSLIIHAILAAYTDVEDVEGVYSADAFEKAIRWWIYYPSAHIIKMITALGYRHKSAFEEMLKRKLVDYIQESMEERVSNMEFLDDPEYRDSVADVIDVLADSGYLDKGEDVEELAEKMKMMEKVDKDEYEALDSYELVNIGGGHSLLPEESTKELSSGNGRARHRGGRRRWRRRNRRGRARRYQRRHYNGFGFGTGLLLGGLSAYLLTSLAYRQPQVIVVQSNNGANGHYATRKRGNGHYATKKRGNGGTEIMGGRLWQERGHGAFKM